MQDLIPIKRCQYRNCLHVIEGPTNKKFCDKKCRKYEYTYNKRELDRLKSSKEEYSKMIEIIKTNSDIETLELYSKIYSK